MDAALRYVQCLTTQVRQDRESRKMTSGTTGGRKGADKTDRSTWDVRVGPKLILVSK